MAADPVWKQFCEDVKARVTDWSFAFGPLEQEHTDSRGWTNGLCPFHSESNPSFGYDRTTGGYRCQSCGETGDAFTYMVWSSGGNSTFKDVILDVARMVGLEPPDKIRAESKKGGKGKSGPPLPATFSTAELEGFNDRGWSYVTRYEYQELDGTIQFATIRFRKTDGTKTFRIAIPDPEVGPDRWKKGLFRRKTIPYRLPQLAEAIKAGRLIFIVEGEKDVHTLEALGCVATCNPEGAGKWKKEFGARLAGALRIAILADNDAPGQAHAQQVAESLWGHVEDIRVVNLPGLPEKGDVTDWIEMGGTLTELRAEINAAPSWTPAAMSGKEELPAGSAATGSLARIIVSDRQERHITDDAFNALRQCGCLPLCYGNVLGRIVRGNNGSASFRHHTDQSLRTTLTVVADWMRSTENGLKAASPGLPIAQNLLTRTDLSYPSLRRIVTVPAMAEDGSIDLTVGYQPNAQVFYAPTPGLTIPEIPEVPTEQQVQDAVDLILGEWLGQFPYVDQAGKAHVLATCLHTFVRDLIDGPTPCVLSDANSPGTGKTKWIEMVTTMVMGTPAGMMAEGGSDEEEWRKRLTTSTLAGSPFLVIDNVKRRVESASLANYLTATVWKDRLLGGNRECSLPILGCVAITGNNLRLSDEIARRSLWVRLDAQMERPWERPREGFKHPDLGLWTVQNRGRLVAALLTLCRAWHVAGRPTGTVSFGSYESWSQVIGGILNVAAVPGLLENANQLHAAADEVMESWRALARLWWEKYAFKKILASDLFSLCKENDILGEAMGAGEEPSQKIRLGKALRTMRDRVVSGYKIRAVEKDKSGRQFYQLDPVIPTSMPPMADGPAAAEDTADSGAGAAFLGAGPASEGWVDL